MLQVSLSIELQFMLEGKKESLCYGYVFNIPRLVHAGHKVGVVQQTETAALKAAGTNRGGPFQRELKQLYTKGTFVDEMTVSELEEEVTSAASSNYLMCIVEEWRGGGGPDELVKTGIIVSSTLLDIC